MNDRLQSFLSAVGWRLNEEALAFERVVLLLLGLPDKLPR